jgi:hypothetical protein
MSSYCPKGVLESMNIALLTEAKSDLCSPPTAPQLLGGGSEQAVGDDHRLMHRWEGAVLTQICLPLLHVQGQPRPELAASRDEVDMLRRERGNE